jgi:uncharacterized membrane protein
MKNQTIRRELLLILLAIIPILFLLINWRNLPDRMPIHFNMDGEPNGYGSKLVFILLPLGIYFLMLALPFIDPRKSNYEIFSETYFKLRIVLGLFIGIINTAIIYNVLHNVEKMGLFVPISVFLLFTLIGNYMGTVRQNYFIGIKVPWTLNSEEVWTRTHKMAGKLWFWSGIVGVASLFVVKDPIFVMIPVLLLIIVVPVIYSYIIYQKITKNR